MDFPNEIWYMIGRSHWSAWERLRQCSNLLKKLLDFNPYDFFTIRMKGTTFLTKAFTIQGVPNVSNITSDGIIIRKATHVSDHCVIVSYRNKTYYYFEKTLTRNGLVIFRKLTYYGKLCPDYAYEYFVNNKKAKFTRETIEEREFNDAEDLCKM